MPNVLVALYDDYQVADRVRTELVLDGFPTDRVELTSDREAAQADTVPAGSRHERNRTYFRSLFEDGDEQDYADFFAEGVRRGGHTITVHPRGDYEIDRAREIMQRHEPVDIDARSAEWAREQRPATGPARTGRGRVCVARERRA